MSSRSASPAGPRRNLKPAPAASERTLHFVEIAGPAQSPVSAPDSFVEIFLAGERRVRVPAEFNPATLTQIVSAVESA